MALGAGRQPRRDELGARVRGTSGSEGGSVVACDVDSFGAVL